MAYLKLIVFGVAIICYLIATVCIAIIGGRRAEGIGWFFCGASTFLLLLFYGSTGSFIEPAENLWTSLALLAAAGGAIFLGVKRLKAVQ